MIAYAAATDVALSFVDQINQVIVFPLIVLMSAVALLVFVWGGFQYVYNAAGSAAHEKGRSHLIYGVIGLLIMVSAYAILEIAANTFDINIDESARGTFSGPELNPGQFGGAIRPNTPATNTGIPAGTTAPAISEASVRAEMAAAGVDSSMQDARWTAMTIGSEANRMDAINASHDLGFISDSTHLSMLKDLQ